MKDVFYEKYYLKFKKPSGTSRGIMREKETYFIKYRDLFGKIHIGECGLLRGLSRDKLVDYEEKLQWLCDHFGLGESILYNTLVEYPSIQFGLEQLFLSLKNGGIYFPSAFTAAEAGIPINGLIWMGDSAFMQEQIRQKIVEKYRCIKLKISKKTIDSEYKIIQHLRNQQPQIEIRVDANGAFSFKEIPYVLEKLAKFQVHSIEQPIRAGNYIQMAELCRNTPVPIALDEELIQRLDFDEKRTLLQNLKPQYIILKPSLLGGISHTKEWIQLATENQIGWWITSALESNIGLSAIAQYTYTLNPKIPQGLGTGGLYTNNIESKLYLQQDVLWMKPS